MTSEDAARTPYPGLRAFRRDESHLFFGRKNCTQTMVARLAATRFLAVVGSSGTGKSSLVNTGLIEALELGFMAEAGSNWRIINFRPGGRPLRNLAGGLLKIRQAALGDESPNIDELDVSRLHVRLMNNRGSLIDWCNDNLPREDANLLIIVDQFEELFSYQDFAGRDEAETFVARLLDIRRAATKAGKNDRRTGKTTIYVTITMRSEYLGACSLIPGLAQVITEGMFLTPRMERKECEEAIKAPAAVCGITIKDELVNRVLNDLSDFASWDDAGPQNSPDAPGWDDQLSRLARRADQLPLMQHALNRMWEDAKAKGEPIELTLEDYEAIDGVTGALNKHANAILRQLEIELGKSRGRSATEAVFRAVTTGKTAADAVRRPTQYGKLVDICGRDAEAVAEVVKAFGAEGRNFLTVSPKPNPASPKIDDDAIVDISHESLIRQWDELGKWVRLEADAADSYRSLERTAKRQQLGKEPYLTHRQLSNIIEPVNEPWAGRYGDAYDLTKKFLEDSRRRYHLKIAGVVGAITAIALFIAGFWEFTKVRFLATVNETAELVDDQLNTGIMTNGDALDVLKPFDAVAGPVEQVILRALPKTMTTDAEHALVHLFDVRSQTEINNGDAAAAEKYANDELTFADLLVAQTLPSDLHWPEYVLDRGSGHERLGDAFRTQGNRKQALDQYRQYSEGLESLRQTKAFDISTNTTCNSPDSGTCLAFIDKLHEFELDQWESHERIGDLQKDEGETDNALAEYRQMRDLADGFYRQWGSDPQWARWKSGHWESFWRFHLAVTDENIGDVLAAQNKFDVATKSYRSMQGEVRQLVEAAQLAPVGDLMSGQPTISLSLENTDWVWTLALSVERLGDMAVINGQYDEATASYNSFLKIVDQLLKRDDNTASWKRAAAIASERLGDVALRQPLSDSETMQSRAAKAQQLYTADQGAASDLATHHAANAAYQRDLSISTEKLGDSALLASDVDNAVQQYKDYNDKAVALVKKDTASSDLQRDKVLSFQRLGEALRAKHDAQQAADNFRKCSDVPGDLVLKDYDPRNGLLERDPASGAFHFIDVASKAKIQDYCKAQLNPAASTVKPSGQ